MMSNPQAICLLTTSATASRTAACNSALRAPGLYSSASSNSTTLVVRGRLPVWVVRMRSVMCVTRCRRRSSPHHLGDMLYIRRRRKTVADELTPLLKIGGLAKVLGVILERLPLHEQPVTLRHFM